MAPLLDIRVDVQICFSSKNVLLCYSTMMNFGGFKTALSQNVKEVRVNDHCTIQNQTVPTEDLQSIFRNLLNLFLESFPGCNE